MAARGASPSGGARRPSWRCTVSVARSSQSEATPGPAFARVIAQLHIAQLSLDVRHKLSLVIPRTRAASFIAAIDAATSRSLAIVFEQLAGVVEDRLIQNRNRFQDITLFLVRGRCGFTGLAFVQGVIFRR